MYPTIDIVPLDPSHLDAVSCLEAKCFGDPWSRSAFESALGNPLYDYFAAVGVQDGLVYGYGGIYTVLDCSDITNIAVSPEMRRCGIARLIMKRLITTARERGAVRLQLEVRESNVPARTLYTSFGFCEDGIRKNYYKNPREDACLMSVCLSGTEEI